MQQRQKILGRKPSHIRDCATLQSSASNLFQIIVVRIITQIPSCAICFSGYKNYRAGSTNISRQTCVLEDCFYTKLVKTAIIL